MSSADTRVILSLAYYGAWVFDITTTSGDAQAFLVASSPGDETLTGAQMTTVTGDIASAIEGLVGVTGCTLTAVTTTLTAPWEAGGYASLVFDDAWTVWGYNATKTGGRTSQAWYAFKGDADASDSVQSAYEGLTGITGCTKVAQPSVSPATV
jgi:hypothetical protein